MLGMIFRYIIEILVFVFVANISMMLVYKSVLNDRRDPWDRIPMPKDALSKLIIKPRQIHTITKPNPAKSNSPVNVFKPSTLIPPPFTKKCFYSRAVVIRLHNPSPKQLERYADWESGFNSTFDVWYIIHRDDPNISYPFDKTFYISTKELMNNYKELSDLRKANHCVEQLNRDDNEFYMWISHSESIILWYETIGRCYNNIWILEQDVGYSGKFSDFLNSYNSDVSDLISYDIREDNPHSYWHYYCESDKYMKYQKDYQSKHNLNEIEYTSREFIQRWSKKLIEIIENEVNNGYHAISETSVAQAVIYHNLTYTLFDKKKISPMFNAFNKLQSKKWKNNFKLVN